MQKGPAGHARRPSFGRRVFEKRRPQPSGASRPVRRNYWTTSTSTRRFLSLAEEPRLGTRGFFEPMP